jgi:hypothetical protein
VGKRVGKKRDKTKFLLAPGSAFGGPASGAETESSNPSSIQFSRGWDPKWDKKIEALKGCSDATFNPSAWGPCQLNGTICSGHLKGQFSKDMFKEEAPALALVTANGSNYLLKMGATPFSVPSTKDRPPTGLHLSLTACEIPQSRGDKFRLGRTVRWDNVTDRSRNIGTSNLCTKLSF